MYFLADTLARKGEGATIFPGDLSRPVLLADPVIQDIFNELKGELQYPKTLDFYERNGIGRLTDLKTSSEHSLKIAGAMALYSKEYGRLDRIAINGIGRAFNGIAPSAAMSFLFEDYRSIGGWDTLSKDYLSRYLDPDFQDSTLTERGLRLGAKLGNRRLQLHFEISGSRLRATVANGMLKSTRELAGRLQLGLQTVLDDYAIRLELFESYRELKPLPALHPNVKRSVLRALRFAGWKPQNEDVFDGRVHFGAERCRMSLTVSAYTFRCEQCLQLLGLDLLRGSGDDFRDEKTAAYRSPSTSQTLSPGAVNSILIEAHRLSGCSSQRVLSSRQSRRILTFEDALSGRPTF